MKARKDNDFNAREALNCTCPLWVDGERNGKRCRQSLGTREMQRGLKRMAALDSPDAIESKPVTAAVEAYLLSRSQLESGTARKYKNILNKLKTFCESAGIATLDQLELDPFSTYFYGRGISRGTAPRELNTLSLFFRFCLPRHWMREDLTKSIELLPAKPTPVVPYSPEEIVRMIAACDVFGRTNYERRRARAMVLLLRKTGLRISDVAMLRRDRVRDGQIFLHTQKTGGQVLLPVPAELQTALDALPAPRGAKVQPEYFFWNGETSRRAAVGIAERTMAAVFRKSGVVGAHAHRFRHTLATDILAKGYGIQDVADVLGISEKIAEKHYAKWSQARQSRISALMNDVNDVNLGGTSVAQKKNAAAIQ